jgi:hypothetical protein
MLRRQPERLILDDLSSPTLITTDATSGLVFIEGYGGAIDPAAVTECFLQCPVACTPQVSTVQVVIPTTCECPYEWGLTIKVKPRLTSYEVQQTFGKSLFYGWSDPAGGTPTAVQTAAGVVANINADPFSPVSAVNLGGGLIQLTEKNCDYITGTAGFSAYTDSGTVLTPTPHVEAILSAGQLNKLFPIQPGMFGAAPKLTFCGTYCQVHLVIKGNGNIQDIDMSSTFSDYVQEVDIYVNNTDAVAYAAFVAAIEAAIPCLA